MLENAKARDLGSENLARVEQYGRSAIRRAGLTWAMLWVLAGLMAAMSGCARKPQTDTVVVTEPPPPDVHALYRETQALEFIRGLGLTASQAGKLVAALETYEPQLKAALSERRDLERELAQLLQERKLLLIEGDDVPPGTKARIDEIRKELLPGSRLSPEQESALANAVRDTLTPEQIAAMPGAVEAREQAKMMLEGFRELSPDEFDAQIGPFAQDLVSQSPDISADDVEALFREARTLSETEYQQNLSKLVAQLAPVFTPSQEATDRLLADAFTQEGMADLLRQIAGDAAKPRD